MIPQDGRSIRVTTANDHLMAVMGTVGYGVVVMLWDGRHIGFFANWLVALREVEREWKARRPWERG